MTLQVLSGVLLVCLGLLLGTTWTIQALQARLRRQAQERRRLNEEWLAIREEWSVIRTTRHQLAKCPRCIEMITATGPDGDAALGGGLGEPLPSQALRALPPAATADNSHPSPGSGWCC
jgi:hypothetical protein